MPHITGWPSPLADYFRRLLMIDISFIDTPLSSLA